jgi:hypothetical protein
MSKEIISALAAASKAVKALPPAPTFDPAPLRAAFEAAQLPEKFIESALRESEAKFIATHGDTGERLIQTVLAELAGACGGIEALSTVAGRMAKAARTEGKTSVTGSQWRAALEGKPEAPEHAALLKRAAKLRADEKPWSKIAEELNLTDAAQSQLYLLVKDGADFNKVFANL